LLGEYTNASTTQLLDPKTGTWADALFLALGLPRELMPDLARPGDALGTLGPSFQADLGVGPLAVIAPATHDTGSAVAGTPLRNGWAYISSGTWSLVGVERAAPLLGSDVARASFTNEGGAFGTVRFLKNVMGLWILESCRRDWEAETPGFDFDGLLAAVAGRDDFPGFVFPDDPRFFNPASMSAEVSAALAESGQPAPDGRVALAKVVLDSLALRYASVLETLEALTGRTVPGVHVVGGGSRNDYLNQATAEACGRPLRAGPAEATALGNLLAQALASGELASLEEGRRLVARSTMPRPFSPRRVRAWDEARRRYREVEARFVARADG
jgi:rhamnulokinase